MPDVLAAIHARKGEPYTGPREFSDTRTRTTAQLVSTDPAGFTATVSLWGSEPISGVPCVPSTYTGVTAVHVLLEGGRPVQVLGPATTAALTTEAPLAQASSVKVVRGRVVSPVYTGTWRVSRGAWDRWNTTSYGGRSDVYQAGSSSSGTLYGFAGYGSQVEALGASKITALSLRLVSNGAGFDPSWTAVVQGSTYGTRPPGLPPTEGSTFTGTVGGYGKAGQVTTVPVPADVAESMRTGYLRGLVLVGGAYGGTYGTGNASGWALVADYEVTS